MSKFNSPGTKTATGHGPIVTERTPSGVTHEGAPGYARDAKSELFLLAVTNMVGEKTFYEDANSRDERFERLVHEVAVADAGWMLGFISWLRGDANMRSASLVAAAESVKARLDAAKVREIGNGARNRQLITAALHRADEPGELLAYWTSRYGRAIPKPVKRGIADALGRLYTEFNLLKYDTASKGYRFGDVLDLVHPEPAAPWQGELFRYALDRRHGHPGDVFSLPMINAQLQLRAQAVIRPELFLDADRLKAAGITWEDALSLVGSRVDKAELWAALIPTMGYMALLRNLRNFDEAGVPDEVAATVAARLADPEQVARSRQLPFRFLSAYRAAPSLRWGHALDKALTASLSNVPSLPGRTLVLVDLSGSMYGPIAGRTQLDRADAAKVFGAALGLRAADTTLVAFDEGSEQVQVPRGGSLLRLVESFPRLGGGTSTAVAMRRWYKGHDRVIILTDEQTSDGNPGGVVPATVPVYTWNLAGYQHGHGPGGVNRHTFGGLSDAAFRMIPLLERGANAGWPWEA